LLDDPQGYHGDKPEILPEWQLRVEARTEGSVTNTYLITSTARHQVGKNPPTVCVISRRFRRSVEDGKARLEVVPRTMEPFRIP